MVGGEGCLEGLGGAMGTMAWLVVGWSFVVKGWLVDG
jgi:hypothetical protein